MYMYVQCFFEIGLARCARERFQTLEMRDITHSLRDTL